MYNVRWWIGMVESTDDPEKLSRVKIRIPGIHTSYTDTDRLSRGYGLPIDDLPYCSVCMPMIYSGTVPPPQAMIGDWVLGISLDGDDFQNLVCLGIIRGNLSAEASGSGGVSASPYQAQNLSQQEQKYDCYEKYYKALDSIPSSSDTTGNGKSCLMSRSDVMKDTISSLKTSDPDKYNNFTKTSGLQVDTSQSTDGNNEDADRILGRSYFDQMMSQMGENPIMAALAFNYGVDKANEYKSYAGLEGKYEDLIKNLKNANFTDQANFIEKFMSAVGDDACLGATGATGDNVIFISRATNKEINAKDEVKAGIVNAAKVTGFDSNLLATIANLESSLNPNCGTGSHIGLFQIDNELKSEMIKNYGSKFGLSSSDDLRDPVKNSLYGAAHLYHNKAILAKKGISASEVNLYITHQLGQGGGPTYLSMAQQNPNASCSTAIGHGGLKQSFFTSNYPFYFTDKSKTTYLTFSQSIQAFQNRLNKVGIIVKDKDSSST